MPVADDLHDFYAGATRRPAKLNELELISTHSFSEEGTAFQHQPHYKYTKFNLHSTLVLWQDGYIFTTKVVAVSGFCKNGNLTW
jgi:hypothetical protein